MVLGLKVLGCKVQGLYKVYGFMDIFSGAGTDGYGGGASGHVCHRVVVVLVVVRVVVEVRSLWSSMFTAAEAMLTTRMFTLER